ncbi:MAG: hypothetical protein JF565_05975 [Propionibacteriales bacterium]|jgi:hypothetical protein|nr:hypothetical protein [Propionibacteriales bacterium]
MTSKGARPSDGSGGGPHPTTPDPGRALGTGSPALAPLMLSLGRLVVTRLVLTRRVRRKPAD